MTKKPDEWTVEFSDQVRAAMAEDPEAAEAIRDGLARMRQAIHDFEIGKYASVDEAMAAIGAERVDVDDDLEDGFHVGKDEDR